jgi:hypothetical protein
MSDTTPVPTKVRTLPVLATVIVVALTLAMLIALPVFAAPVSAPAVSSGASPALAPATDSNVQTWAYEGTKTITGDITVTNSNGKGFELQYHAFYGWAVVFTQTNNTTYPTPPTGFELEAQRTASAQLYVNVCSPTCAAATFTANYTAMAMEQATAFGNFTNEGTVYVDSSPGDAGTATPALGFLNGSGAVQDSLLSELTVTGALGHVSHWWFNVTGSAQAQVDFDPELGLIPFTLTSGEVWNSSAAFVLSGSYDLMWTYVSPTGMASGNPSGSISASGIVNLTGAYSNNLVLNNHEHTHILLIGLTGPFDLRDGVIILPHMGNVFSGDPSALGGQSLGFAPVDSTAAVDYDSSSSHLGIAAAASTFGPTTAGVVPATSLTPAATSPEGGTVQAQPVSVATAQACSASLAKGGDCATTGPNGLLQFFHTTVGELVVLAVGVVVLVAVLAAAVGRRPKTPPPVRVPSPQAPVPPGASGQVAPPPRTPPQQPSDPLGNLW